MGLQSKSPMGQSSIPQGGSLDAQDLFARHELFFETKTADRQELVEAAQALRYQVYCVERKFEDADQHALGLERDEYDASAIHGLLYYRPTNRPMGTVRMILPNPQADSSLPIMGILHEQGLDLCKHLRLEETVEISRFAISKNLRRRRDDQQEESAVVSFNRGRLFRDGNLPCLSLITFLVRESRIRGIHYWAAVMEPKLLRMLAGMGIHFTAIGGLIMHHGLRQPSYCHVENMLSQLRQSHPDHWDILTNRGEFGPAHRTRTASLQRIAG